MHSRTQFSAGLYDMLNTGVLLPLTYTHTPESTATNYATNSKSRYANTLSIPVSLQQFRCKML